MFKGLTTSLSRPRWLLRLSSQCHAVLVCPNDAFMPLTFESFLMHSNHVFLGRPLELLSFKIVFSTSLGHVSGSICRRWLYQWRGSRLITFFMQHRPNQFLSSSDGILSITFVEQIHLNIISLQLRWETSFCVAAKISLGYLSDGTYSNTHPTNNNTFTSISNPVVPSNNIWFDIISFRFEAKFNCWMPSLT